MNHEPLYKPNPYLQFGVIVLLILVPSTLLAFGPAFSWQELMMNVMAGYFLVFGGFKLLNLRSFVDGYATYDLLAGRIKLYGYVYPFLEITLGLAYLLRYQLDTVHWITLIFMLFGAAGVAFSKIQKKGMQCACLGNIIELPLSSITLIEDLLMAAMAAAMLTLI